MQPKSHTLFHFTKNVDFLKDILKNGFWPRYCLEDARWYSQAGNDFYIAYPIVCFCDIPLSRVDEHVDFYGNYGIGVTREWAESNRLAPILYLRENTEPHEALKQLFINNINSKFYSNAGFHINTLLANVKPTEGTMRFGEDVVRKEFYQENEWRFSITVPDMSAGIRPWLSEEEFRNKEVLDGHNAKNKELSSLKISPSDIKYLFVKSDSDIPLLVNFIQTELDMYPSHDIKILLSRIISLETISRDL